MSDENSNPGRGAQRGMLIAIVVVIVIIIAGGLYLFGGKRVSNPVSTAGSASQQTTAPGDRPPG